MPNMSNSLATILQSLQLSPASQSLHVHGAIDSASPESKFHGAQALDYGSCSDLKMPSASAESVPVESFTPFDSALATIYRYREQRSVNLGSWFVHERWMVGSHFKCSVGHQDAELDIAMGWGSPDNAKAILEKHWEEFITESDFANLASLGINTVRLPIGFWNLPGEEFMLGTPFEGVGNAFVGSWARIVRAVNWASKYNIGVLIDLHGAAGSQNGQSHSGVSDGNSGLFDSEEYMDTTLAALTFLSSQFCSVTNVVGIELLNEPTNHDRLPEFYTRGIEAMRNASEYGSSCPLYIHDGFDLDRFTDFVSARKDFVVLDYHSYFVFTPEDNAEPASGHTSDIQTSLQTKLKNANKRLRQNLIIGEWSCALTPQSLDAEQDHAQARKDFCMAQLELYNKHTSGHHFWSYKLDHQDEGWSFLDAVKTKSIPGRYSAYKGLATPSFLGSVDGLVPRGIAAPVNVKARSVALAARSLSPSVQHRAIAINLRRQAQAQAPLETPTQTSSGPDDFLSSGYLDGFEAAKMFARKYSKLGFRGQYIHDRIQNLKQEGEGQIHFDGDSDEKEYKEGFEKGLKEAEGMMDAL